MQSFQETFLEEPVTKASHQGLVLLNTRISRNHPKITMNREKLLKIIQK